MAATFVLYARKPWAAQWIVWPWVVMYVLLVIGMVLPASWFPVWTEFVAVHRANITVFCAFTTPVVVVLHVVTILSTFWSVAAKCRLQYSRVSNAQQAQYACILPSSDEEPSALLRIQRLIQEEGGVEVRDVDVMQPGDTLLVSHQGRRYFLQEDGTFRKSSLPTKLTFGAYRNMRGFGKEAAELTQSRIAHGENTFVVPIPTFKELFFEHAVSPFFAFQMFCVVLWCLDEYWYYSIFTGAMLVVFESTVVNQRLRNLKELGGMETPVTRVTVFRGGRWSNTLSNDLLPGDVVSLTRVGAHMLAPCDLLLLEGTTVVNEALLTGESTPQVKESFTGREDTDVLDIKHEDKRHIVYGGTHVLSCHRDASLMHSSPFGKGNGGENGCIGIVLRTGFETAQGRLVRIILHSTGRVSANNTEAFAFISCLLCFAVVASAYVLYRGLQDPDRSRYKIMLNCTVILTSVVPPELPMELSLAVNTSLLALSKLGVFCTEPFRIPFAGGLDTCCFDKTGTLTADAMIMRGVAESGLDLLDPKEVGDMTQCVLAGCHSLMSVEGDLVGDSMERAALRAVRWHPRGMDVVQSAKGGRWLQILHRHPFLSTLKRMAAVAIAQNDERYCLVKGAPEVLKALFVEIPANYDAIFMHYTRQGARVIALGYKTLPKATRPSELRSIPRREVECGLTFAGFGVFECPLKPDSLDVIQDLRASGHRVAMVTGDNELTAAHVAGETAIVDRDVAFLRAEGGAPVWRDADDRLVAAQVTHGPSQQYDLCASGEALQIVMAEHPKWLVNWVDKIVVFARCAPSQKEAILVALKAAGHTTLMCGDGTNDMSALKQAHVGVALLTGKVADSLEGPQQSSSNRRPTSRIPKTGPRRTRVQDPPPKRQSLLRRIQSWFAEQQRKNEEIIQQRQGVLRQEQSLQPVPPPTNLDDGRNAPPVVKLGDASIASPFTSKSSSIRSTAHIARLGRCTLVTTLQMYKILALNCLVSAYSMSVLYSDGVKFGETQMMLIGIMVAVCFLCISRSKPLETLSPERPYSRVFTPYIMLSIVGQFAMHLYCLVTAVAYVREAESAVELKAVDLEADFTPTLMNTVVFLITTAQQVATFANNYRGEPWMTGLLGNRPLVYCLALLALGTCLATLQWVPAFNEYMELVPMEPEVSGPFLKLLCGNAVGVFLYERVLLLAFKRRKPLPTRKVSY